MRAAICRDHLFLTGMKEMKERSGACEHVASSLSVMAEVGKPAKAAPITFLGVLKRVSSFGNHYMILYTSCLQLTREARSSYIPPCRIDQIIAHKVAEMQSKIKGDFPDEAKKPAKCGDTKYLSHRALMTAELFNR